MLGMRLVHRLYITYPGRVIYNLYYASVKHDITGVWWGSDSAFKVTIESQIKFEDIPYHLHLQNLVLEQVLQTKLESHQLYD